MHSHSPTQVHTLKPHQIRSALLIAGLEWWERSAGRICPHDEQLNQLFPSLQICADSGHDWPPAVLCVGPEGDFARLFGSKIVNDVAPWSSAAHDSAGYLQVRHTRQPAIEHVKSRPIDVGGNRVWVSYERLIVPGSLSSRRDLYLVFNKIERVLCEAGGTDCRPSA